MHTVGINSLSLSLQRKSGCKGSALQYLHPDSLLIGHQLTGNTFLTGEDSAESIGTFLYLYIVLRSSSSKTFPTLRRGFLEQERDRGSTLGQSNQLDQDKESMRETANEMCELVQSFFRPCLSNVPATSAKQDFC